MGNKFDFEHFYVVEKPMYKRAASYDTHYHFKVKQRNGNDIVFSNSDRKDICEYPGLTFSSLRLVGRQASFQSNNEGTLRPLQPPSPIQKHFICIK